MAIYLEMNGLSPPITISGAPRLKKRAVVQSTSLIKKGKKRTIYKTPATLKRAWALAVRRALMLLPMLASCAVMVVPILSPRMKATLDSKPKSPWLAKAMAIPTVALELCRIMVRRVPAKTQRRMPLRLSALNIVKKAMKAGSSRRGEKPAFMVARPKKIRPNPNKTSPP